MFPQR